MVNEIAKKGIKPGKEECFVIAPLGDDGSSVRQRTEKVIEYFIEPAVKGRYEVITVSAPLSFS